jgi:dolichyl-phosphate-mannose-protein mannosyltransferase
MAFNLDTKASEKWSVWGIIAVCAMSIVLRFWGIGRFNEFVFDEIYYAKFANNYLTNTQFYNAHPPLSQYLIAIGMWIGDRLPIGQDITNTLTGSRHSTFSYRWMNALFGSLIPPLVGALAYQLNRRMSYAFLATLFISLDGLFLVDSRYALNNVFLIFFGMLGQLLVLIASRIKGDLAKPTLRDRQILLTIGAGISFGASAACKWNGLWFLLGIYILIVIAKIWVLIKPFLQPRTMSNSLLDKLGDLHPVQLITSLAIVPAFTYTILWIPHLIQNPRLNFWEMQLSILNYHEQVGNGAAIHPYCADWYTWPLMLRPLAYYYQQDRSTQLYTDVHAMGNPFLWWFAFAAIFILLGSIIKDLGSVPISKLKIERIGIPLFIVVNYAANLLPWVRVTRCIFIYHYMGAVLFATIGLAWLIDICLLSSSKLLQGMGLTTIFTIAGGFVFWLPIYLGLPIDGVSLSLRMWNFWIFKWT